MLSQNGLDMTLTRFSLTSRCGVDASMSFPWVKLSFICPSFSISFPSLRQCLSVLPRELGKAYLVRTFKDLFFFFFLKDRASLSSVGWPWIHSKAQAASQFGIFLPHCPEWLGLQAVTTMPDRHEDLVLARLHYILIEQWDSDPGLWYGVRGELTDFPQTPKLFTQGALTANSQKPWHRWKLGWGRGRRPLSFMILV